MNARSERAEFWCSDARHQLLAGAALAVDQDRRPARRRLDDQVEHLPHARALADDLAEAVGVGLQVLPQRAVLGDQPPLRQRVAQDDQHLVVLERLGDVVEGAALHRRDGVLDRGERGDHQHRQVVVDLLDLVERRDAVHARQHDVDDRRVERHRARELEPLGRRRGQAHLVALARQQRLEDLAHDLLVVDDEDGARCASCGSGLRPSTSARLAATASGRRIENRVPCPTWLSHVIVPPCSCTMP